MTDFKQKALIYAERIGIYEYIVTGSLMEYISFYGSEGWWRVRVDLNSMTEISRELAFPWEGFIPEELLGDGGATLYNYMEG